MKLHGFEIVEKREIPEVKSVAFYYRHARTGAELVSVVNNDENKVFGITFRTPPTDSTGVAQILEHSVLCGSRRFPVKDPFVELLKSSVNSFLNAFTYPDKTCFPVASQNTQDFYNIIGVYLDAVFFPRLTREVFMQEGWHYEVANAATGDAEDATGTPDTAARGESGLAGKYAEDKNSRPSLNISGVVFGEMKGVFSSPESLLAEQSQASLFPDTLYRFNSGGDPECIPLLTYEAFVSFHSRYYHPSNSYIFFWGDDDPTERLRILDAYLSQFDAKETDSSVKLQPRLTESRLIVKSYSAAPCPVGATGDADETEVDGAAGGFRGRNRAMVTVNWLLPEVTDPELTMSFSFLAHVLAGTAASPLHKALIDSGIGEDVSGAGLEGDLRQMYYSIGLNGIHPDRAEEVEKLIFSVLESLATEGIPRDLLEASINSLEFHLREGNSGSFPKGLVYMLKSLRTWIYGADPLGPLAFEERLARIKSRVFSGEAFFENMIREHFLDNKHRSRVLLVPDTEEEARREKLEQDRLAQIRDEMTNEDILSIAQQSQKLRELQQTPDSPEAIATIPSLSVSDMPREWKITPQTDMPLLDRESALLFCNLDTTGIVYFTTAFDLSVIPEQDLWLLPLFGRAIMETGTETRDFVAMTRQINAKTGGIGATSVCSIHESGSTMATFVMSGKAMLDKGPELTSLMRELLLSARLDNRERVRQLLIEDKSQYELGLVSGGHAVVDVRVGAGLSDQGWVTENTCGLSHLFYLRELVANFDKEWPQISERMENVRRRVFNRGNILAGVTLDEKGFKQFQPCIEEFVGSLPSEKYEKEPWGFRKSRLSIADSTIGTRNEGLVVPAQIHAVGKGANLADVGYKFHGSALVILRVLRNSWLWDKVRVQGGAYGASCKYDRLAGTYASVSYRDPNLERTINVFDDTAEYLATTRITQEEIDRNIVGAVGDMDSYQLPDAKGYAAFFRKLSGTTSEIRAKIRQEVFETTESHFREFGKYLALARDKGIVVVMGNEESLSKAAAPLGLRLIPLF